ncbi:hypothetical protein HID58_054000 [Brassica napus]|uniref:(rape) hypothetical protein n=1 Tax=Brassica napus TaxID=3708 RepID=A0A816ID68_BRANA|nr:hypothetical protein HID58_054000 [Brassica napus]CAF1704998.1 unnamed protein product [Brassica napus]
MATTGNKNINAKLIRFSMLFPSNNIFNTIAKLGFTEPTPIQAQGWPMALKVGEEPVSLTKRRFRSKNIEPIPFWKMQVVPFNGKLVKAKKRCHWCGTRGCEDLVSCLSCGREFFCVDCIDKRYLELLCLLSCLSCLQRALIFLIRV